MRPKILVLAVVVGLLLVGTVAMPAGADPGVLYVDDDQVGSPDVVSAACAGNVPCYAHPQDAVNAASPGDTILVYPGTYGSRQYTSPTPPHWSAPNDQWAPALIVYRDGLTIESVEGPANTVIESTHNYWSNPVAIQASTGGIWNGSAYVGAGVNPTEGSAPNAVTIIASDVTIEGFTLHRHYEGTWATYNTAGIFIGALCAGCSEFLGSNGNTVEGNAFSDVWHAVYIWHSSDNAIVGNTVAALDTNHWAAISTYDGYNDAQIALGNLSENNYIAHNSLANKGIALGAWEPPTWTSNAGSGVCHNTATQVGVSYANGPVIIGCNSGGFWQYNTSDMLRVTGVAYTGQTSVAFGPANVTLRAQVAYDGSADGSGVSVLFSVNGSDYGATTGPGGVASTTAYLEPGVYTVDTRVTVCDDDCVFSDSDQLVVLEAPTTSCPTGQTFVNSRATTAVPISVTEGFDYRVTVAGTFYAGGISAYDIQADAEYSQDTYQRTHLEPWSDLVRGYESSGEGLLEMTIDGAFLEWGSFTPLHRYTRTVAAVDSSMDLLIYDTYPQNNTGGLCVALDQMPEGEITSPEEGEVVFGTLDLEALYFDDNPSGVQWAVRKGTCAAATDTVAGNVDGFHTPFSWTGAGSILEPRTFSSDIDVSGWETGAYCFVFNPSEGTGEPNMRLTRWFFVGEFGSLEPALAYNPLGTEHTVTASLGAGVEGVEVLFEIEGPNEAESGTAVTDSAGVASFTWTGTYPGTDVVTACLDLDDSSTCDPGEPAAPNTAVKYWLVEWLTGGGKVLIERGWATFGGVVGADVYAAPHGQWQLTLHGLRIAGGHRTQTFHTTQITSVALAATGGDPEQPTAMANQLTFSATGRFEGEDGWSIEVTATDNGEPGSYDTLAFRLFDPGHVERFALGQTLLAAGNLQIHES